MPGMGEARSCSGRTPGMCAATSARGSAPGCACGCGCGCWAPARLHAAAPHNASHPTNLLATMGFSVALLLGNLDRRPGRRFPRGSEDGNQCSTPALPGPASAARVVCRVQFLEAFPGHVGIDLGGGEIAVAEQHL